MNEDTLLITEKDYLRIRNIIESTTSNFENLELELDRASIITDSQVPGDLVTMNSKVRFLNKQDNREQTVTLVYPKDANLDEGKISVLAPMGSALIGLKVNQEINWMFPDGKTKTLKILEVLYQPEAHGDWHL